MNVSVCRLFAAGDASTTEDVRRRVRRILAFRGYGIPQDDRVDLEQSVMLELWQAVARPEFDSTRFWGFVEVVTGRRCIDWIRASKMTNVPGSLSLLEDPTAGPLGRALVKEKATLAEAALARLPPDCRELVDLHYRKQKSYSEIAGILERSEGSLRVRMHRCIQKASRILLEIARAGEHKKSDLNL